MEDDAGAMLPQGGEGLAPPGMEKGVQLRLGAGTLPHCGRPQGGQGAAGQGDALGLEGIEEAQQRVGQALVQEPCFGSGMGRGS